MFTAEIKWLIGTVLVGALLIFALVKILPKGFISGLFGSDRQTIQDTPLAVKEIRGIGELIAAEYFGEVIHSLNDGYTSQQAAKIEGYYDTLHLTLDSLYENYSMGDEPTLTVNTRSLKREKDKPKRRRKWSERKKAAANDDTELGSEDEPNVSSSEPDPELSRREIREQKEIEEEIWVQVMGDDYLEHLMASINFNLLLELNALDLPRASDKKKLELCQIIKEKSWNEFRKINDLGAELDQVIKDKEQEKRDAIELTYLGRGWVKAGYNLNKLNDEQIERRADTLIIRDINPEILNADINPWFIPPSKNYKKGSPGFTVLRVRVNGKDVEKVSTAGPRADVEEESRRRDRNKIPLWAIDSVKRGTKRALLLNALQSHILDSARTSAERTLLRLFQLVEPDTLAQIQVLKMVPSRWFRLQKEVMDGDYCISEEETMILRSYFKQDLDSLDEEFYLLESNKCKARNELAERWQLLVLELDVLTLCVANDPAWNHWRDIVLNRQGPTCVENDSVWTQWQDSVLNLPVTKQEAGQDSLSNSSPQD